MLFFVMAALLWALTEGDRLARRTQHAVAEARVRMWDRVTRHTDRLTWWAHARYGAAVRGAL